MLQGLYAASSGMEAQQNQFNAISNDLANLDTTGYQSTDVGFQDLLYTNGGVSSGSQVTTGAGASSSVIGRNQTQGALQQTGRNLDVAIQGEGYLEFRQANGSIGLSRDGDLQVDKEGRLCNQQGDLIQPPVTLPKGADSSKLSISANGTVSYDKKTIGKIQIVNVPAPDQLQADGSTMFTATTGSGAPRPVTGSTLVQGSLEGSNVDINQAMSSMIDAERSYEMSSKAVQYQDQMLQIANQLRK